MDEDNGTIKRKPDEMEPTDEMGEESLSSTNTSPDTRKVATDTNTPESAPRPASVPMLTPKPEPQSQPAPKPVLQSAPVPTHAPQPTPKHAHAHAPESAPRPAPRPQPVPVPTPTPAPRPQPTPKHAHAPQPRDGTTNSTARTHNTPLAATGSNNTPEDTSKKKKFSIPALRTFEHDRMRVAQTKGGAELRSMLAREMEKKKEAQQAYKKNVKELMKESIILREKKRSFLKKQYEKTKDDEEEKDLPAQKDTPDHNHIKTSASNITEYMMGLATKTPENKPLHTERATGTMPDGNTDTAPMGAMATGMQPPDTTGNISNPMTPTPPETTAVGADKGRKLTILERLRGIKKPGEVFTKEEREAMKQQQEEIVEKESMRDRWKEFEKKKEQLRSQGIQARDIRSYDVNQEKPPIAQRKNTFAIVLILVILVALVTIVISIATRPSESPELITQEELKPRPNVVNSEHRVLVDISTSSEDWGNISRNRGSQNIVTQYIPYKINGEKSEQINLQEFSSFFGMNLPTGLLETLDDYYFVGNYTTNTNPNGLLVLSVKNYNDALVWMLNWEKNAINAFHTLFPNTVRRSQPGNTSVERKVIDNKDIRILKNQESEYRLMYYFFNRSVLVFIVGNENVIPYINARIRSANAG